MNKTWIGSPNYDTNRKPIQYIVIHWFGVGSLQGADNRFLDDASDVSAHYAVEDEIIHQYVREEHVAYHAGNYAINQASIGIEHSATVERDATEQTYITSAKLIREICDKHNIPIDSDHIVPHNRYRATQCPGTMDIAKLIEMAKGGAEDSTSAWASQADRMLQEAFIRSITTSDRREDYLKDDAFKVRLFDHIDTQEGTKQAQAQEIIGLKDVNKQQAEMIATKDAQLQAQQKEIERLDEALERCEGNVPSVNVPQWFRDWLDWLAKIT